MKKLKLSCSLSLDHFYFNDIICLTGDHQHFGDHASCANVFDLDSAQLAMTVRMMRDEGRLLGGQQFEVRPQWAAAGSRGRGNLSRGKPSGLIRLVIYKL